MSDAKVLYLFTRYIRILKSFLEANQRDFVDVVINHSGKAQADDTYGAKEECSARVAITAEGNNRVLVLLDVHRLYNQQIVEQGDNRVDQSNEDQQILTCLKG